MKFNPLTKEIFTNKGEFLKKMNCPFKMKWEQFEVEDQSMSRKCSYCSQSIIDTQHLTDEDLLLLVKSNPETCIKIDLNQSNLQIITNGILEQK